MKVQRLWGGRFEALPSKEIIDFLSGRDVRGLSPCDERLIPYDLWGSRAHVLMLCRQGILSRQDGKKILRGLNEVETLHQQGKFKLDSSKEDVHSNIESYLIERLGIEYGGKVHTGRSRNDQIALDMRLYLRDEVLAFADQLLSLIAVLLQRVREHRRTVMPGYTHHQHATVTTLGHLLLSFAEALERDVRRWLHWMSLFNKNPLGAAAGYGTSFNLDRGVTSTFLGFDGPTGNVTDPITQRWEPEVEVAYAAAVMMDHLSTMAQTLILLSTEEFNMVRLDDRHCTGSSIMPQKRNPCSLEVIKAKTSFAHGILVSLLSAGKSLFVGYNRDTQWTKYWIMDLVDECKPALPVMTEVIRLLRANEERMFELAQKGFVGATTLMEWMVQSQRIPLRKAKMAMEKAVKYSEMEQKEEVSYQGFQKALRELRINIPVSERDVKRFQKPDWGLSQLQSVGSPSERKVKESMDSLRKRMRSLSNEVIRAKRGIEKAKEFVYRLEKALGK